MSAPDRETAVVWVTGGRGMVGSAVWRALVAAGYRQVVAPTREELDLIDPAAVRRFVDDVRPTYVIHAAGKVGGIHANNTYPAEFIHDNLAMCFHVVDAAWRGGVPKLLFLGSSCIYPRMAPQPIPEEALLTGPLEKTNEAYAVAKIAGLKLCEYYRQQYGVTYFSAMPTNLYGPGDNYHPQNAHVLPALLRRFDEAHARGDEAVTIWGTGKPYREFLYVDDLAEALVHLLAVDDPPDLINVGSGQEVSIAQLAEAVKATVGFTGEIRYDTSKPDGTPRKRLVNDRIEALGWAPRVTLEEGLRRTYAAYQEEKASGRLRD